MGPQWHLHSQLDSEWEYEKYNFNILKRSPSIVEYLSLARMLCCLRKRSMVLFDTLNSSAISFVEYPSSIKYRTSPCAISTVRGRPRMETAAIISYSNAKV